ncbi:ATP-dependent RecD-like DNA helicase [Erysipelothrix rhusiopathiae]|uniref:SF1B family DNA helicase RecD2 n=1 Tax=Erysipelothrix rhusiopathiae TaxID=1648 RepID=UPI001EDE6074|nr:ATP-dependent RecD-like DNA helicase [Erysipelothrix rhusiopathiae]MCG4436555.1 ATP-dependent RecD-like DNA helicase [Erysipelothrix rhusiopathiae]MDE8044375.1 ATP-dependent RecD-like DNA helicase [Erysipelothrix rhusiopathiae]MDE8059820.1 ATP-dependent RecD-like DNA helicase [Erysipelothrix rhusiopathiae]MDE8069188.1 ATP-dependent RecD-like DNA helicase [Erysipelothrix rhusiopathiae]MDE8071087.1 ATP-dependent RecD-like DNA helicase [Erysipelothrix rhusiopathiae]
MEQTIKGSVETCIFKNEQSGYGIFRIVLFNSNQKPMTIKGPLATLELDSFYEFTGDYVEDPRYGMQFDVIAFKQMLPQHRDFIIRFLSGPNFPGIGQKTATAVVDTYGEDVLDQIREDESFKLEVKGITAAKAEMIVSVIRKQDAQEDAVSFLLAHGLGNKQIIKITKEYGDNAISVIRENPYRLVYDVDGIGFKTADKVAMSLGYALDDPLRVEALVLDRYKTICFGAGDSFITKDKLFDGVRMGDAERVESAYQALVQSGELVEDGDRLYHRTQYDSEVYVTQTLKDFKYSGYDFDLDDLESKIASIESQLRIEFDDTQREAIESFLCEDVMILTGGPGTGKSTLLSGVVTLLQANCPWLHITLCAPTGRAAKRLEELTNVQAATIHSVLKWDLESNKFGMHEENPLETDILIIDEFSMVDTWLLAHILKASEKVKKLLFVGDKDQLPSVSSGFVLGDLIASKVFKTISLERNYRQEAGSEVIDLAVNMNQGLLDVSNYHRDVRFFDSRYGSVKDIVLKVVDEAMQRGYDLSDIQVLAPMYSGPAGIDNLNHFLQKMCNPESPQKAQIMYGTRIFREGDKILQLKNQPDDFVFNGDIGMLVEVEAKRLVVDFDGNFVEYEPSSYINITHAYAMSVHKAQGSEYPIVILVAVRDFYRMLSRRLYYTGATRSSKSLVLVGELEAFNTAVENHHEAKRNTYLTERLQEAFEK